MDISGSLLTHPCPKVVFFKIGARLQVLCDPQSSSTRGKPVFNQGKFTPLSKSARLAAFQKKKTFQTPSFKRVAAIERAVRASLEGAENAQHIASQTATRHHKAS